MSDIFITLLNMSITASYLVLAVILLRLIFRKAPKIISCFLWILVGLRLIFPLSIESALSLVPSSETIPQNITTTDSPGIHSGSVYVNQAVNSVLNPMTPMSEYSANPMQIVMTVASYVWLAGVFVLLLYALISYLKLRKEVAVSINTKDNIYLCDYIDAPFILGVFRPKIYIPSHVSEGDITHIIAHEKSHLKRRDHLWKPLGFILLSVYWFNPVIWIAYILLCRDIELACDEKVIKEMEKDDIKSYSIALLNCSVSHHAISACPVAFGETGVKGRIKAVLNYKKPAFWVIITAVILSLIVTVCFMTNPLGMKLTELCEFNASYSLYYEISTPDGTYSSYENEDIEEMYEKLKKVRVDETPLDESRSEERDKTYSISFAKKAVFNFNADFTEVWFNDGVKPSYTYKVKNPETLIDIFDVFKLAGSSSSAVAFKSGTETEGVSIKLKSIDLESDEPYIKYEWVNDTDFSLGFDERCDIYFIDGDKKIDCMTPDAWWNEPACMLLPHKSLARSASLNGFDLSREGTYRFEKEYSIGETYHCIAWIEFEVSAKSEIIRESEVIEDTGGAVLFYSKPTDEHETPDIKYYNRFSEDDFEIFLSSLKTNRWTSDLLTDRISFNFDGQIHLYNDCWVYFGYEQKVAYYNEYYCTLTSEQIKTLKNLQKKAAKYVTADMYADETKESIEKYVFTNSVDPVDPVLILKTKDNTFTFTYSVFSSYIAMGTYRWEGQNLILSADDEIHGYVFRKENNTLVFDGIGSSAIPEYKYSGADKAPQSPVPDGAVFELKTKTEIS